MTGTETGTCLTCRARYTRVRGTGPSGDGTSTDCLPCQTSMRLRIAGIERDDPGLTRIRDSNATTQRKDRAP
jgi:hypothetical protein